MSNPYAPIIPRWRHMKRYRAPAAPLEARKARAGQPVLGGWVCGIRGCGAPYRYAHVGEVRGACHVVPRRGQSVQPHEYMLCPDHPALPICLTHSQQFGSADQQFRREAADVRR